VDDAAVCLNEAATFPQSATDQHPTTATFDDHHTELSAYIDPPPLALAPSSSHACNSESPPDSSLSPPPPTSPPPQSSPTRPDVDDTMGSPFYTTNMRYAMDILESPPYSVKDAQRHQRALSNEDRTSILNHLFCPEIVTKYPNGLTWDLYRTQYSESARAGREGPGTARWRQWAEASNLDVATVGALEMARRNNVRAGWVAQINAAMQALGVAPPSNLVAAQGPAPSAPPAPPAPQAPVVPQPPVVPPLQIVPQAQAPVAPQAPVVPQVPVGPHAPHAPRVTVSLQAQYVPPVPVAGSSASATAVGGNQGQGNAQNTAQQGATAQNRDATDHRDTATASSIRAEERREASATSAAESNIPTVTGGGKGKAPAHLTTTATADDENPNQRSSSPAGSPGQTPPGYRIVQMDFRDTSAIAQHTLEVRRHGGLYPGPRGDTEISVFPSDSQGNRIYPEQPAGDYEPREFELVLPEYDPNQFTNDAGYGEFDHLMQGGEDRGEEMDVEMTEEEAQLAQEERERQATLAAHRTEMRRLMGDEAHQMD
jgi:hypothetical protein